MMDIKNSFVYKGIRKAAAENLLSRSTIRFFVYLAMIILVIGSLFFTPTESLSENSVLLALLTIMIFGFLLFFDTMYLIKIVKVVISPEKSIVATRYADIISFEEMCMRVEEQRQQPLVDVDMERWGINALADFIVYRCHADFGVIPYSVIREICPGEVTRGNRYTESFFVSIQDIFLHSYTIVCESTEKRDQIIYNLDEALRIARKNGNYL